MTIPRRRWTFSLPSCCSALRSSTPRRVVGELRVQAFGGKRADRSEFYAGRGLGSFCRTPRKLPTITVKTSKSKLAIMAP